MNSGAVSIAMVLALATAAFGEVRATMLSAADCALLQEEFSVTPPGCAAPASKPVVRASVSSTPDIEAAPLPKLTDTMQESHIFFLAGGSTLDDSARQQLVRLVAQMKDPALVNVCLKLIGHSDRSGPPEPNKVLSEQRAQTVTDFLSAALGSSRIAETSGAGFEQPLNGFPAGARENRRVAIYLGPCPISQAP